MSIRVAMLDAMLPGDCLLCGASGPSGLPCAACAAELPRLPSALCPVCAETSPGGAVCGQCLSLPPHFDATFAVFRYAFPVDKLVQALKYGHRLAIADFFAQALLDAPALIDIPADLIVPLPLSPQRLAGRGFNQAVEIARPLARTLKRPLQIDGMARPLDTAPQAMLPWKARRDNVRHAFECSIDLTGKSAIVVDDVMTTGATLDEFARTLKAHGAARVTNLVVARTLRE
ncbi:MAG: ComF family protein [Rhodocyclaceae bacterium]|nr:ComF family protein [Rhodocyclaceae bacterium]